MDISRPHSPSSNSSAIDISSHPHSPSASHSAIPLAGPSSPSSLTTTTGNDLLGSFPRRRTSWGKLVENGQDPLQRDLFSDSMSHSQPPHHRSSSATDDDPFGSYSLDYVPPTQGQIQIQNSYGHGYGQPPYSTPRAGASTAALIHRDSTTSSDYDSIRERDDVRLTSHMSRQPTDDYDFPPSPPLDSPPSDDMVDSERGGGVGGGGGEGMRRRTVRYEGVQGGGGQMLHRTGSTFRNVSRGLRRVSLRVVNLAGKGLDEHTRLNDLPDDDDDMSASAPRTGSGTGMERVEAGGANGGLGGLGRSGTEKGQFLPEYRKDMPLRGRTMGFLGPESSVRLAMYRFLVYPWTEPTILLLIIVNAVVLTIQGSRTVVRADEDDDPPGVRGYFHRWEDWVLFILFVAFTLEAFARIAVTGFILDPEVPLSTLLMSPFTASPPPSSAQHHTTTTTAADPNDPTLLLTRSSSLTHTHGLDRKRTITSRLQRFYDNVAAPFALRTGSSSYPDGQPSMAVSMSGGIPASNSTSTSASNGNGTPSRRNRNRSDTAASTTPIMEKSQSQSQSQSLASLPSLPSHLRTASHPHPHHHNLLRSDHPASSSPHNPNALSLPFRFSVKGSVGITRRNVPYLRHSWSRIDAVAILCFWVSFALAEVGVERGSGGRHVGIFRALSVLRTARLLTVTSGTTTIMRSLKIARPLLTSVAYFVLFAMALFSIIGVQSFSGSFRRSCFLNATLGVPETDLSQSCGGYIDPATLNVTGYVQLDGGRHETSKGYICPLGQTCREVSTNPYSDVESFDTIYNSALQVFIVSSANGWSPLMYSMIDAEFFMSCFFFIVCIVVLNFWLINLFVAVITNTFSAIREETHKSAFGAAPLQITDEQGDAWVASETRHKPNRIRDLYEHIRWCWVALALFSLVLQATKEVDINSTHQDILTTGELGLTIAFDVEILIRVAAHFPDWRAFFAKGQNWLDLVLAVGSSVIQIPVVRDSEVYPWLTIFQLMRFYRVILEIPRMKPLLLSVFGNMYGLANMTLFLLLVNFIAALAALQLLQGDLTADDNMNFGQIYTSFLAMYQIFSSENWTTVLYDSADAESGLGQTAIVCLFFSAWFFFANFIMLQMFIAVINENFNVAEESKRGRQADDYWAAHQPQKVKATWVRKLNPYRWFSPSPKAIVVENLPSNLVLPMQKALVQDYGLPGMERRTSRRKVDGKKSGSGHVTSKSLSVLQQLFIGDTKSNDMPLANLKTTKRESVNTQNPNDDEIERQLELLASFGNDVAAAEEMNDALHERRAQKADFIRDHPSYDKTFWVFSQKNAFRRWCQSIVRPADGERIFGRPTSATAHTIFQFILLLTVIGGIVVESIATPIFRRNFYNLYGHKAGAWFDLSEAVFGLMLVVEFVIKVIADGFLFTPNAYVRSIWNVLDFVIMAGIVVNVTTGLIFIGGLSRFTRALKALRALRLITLVEKMRTTFESLILSGASRIFDAAMLAILYMIPYAVWGLNIFAGLMNECNDSNSTGISDCIYEYENNVVGGDDSPAFTFLVPRVWDNPSPSTTYSFDSFRSSLLILFEIVSLEGWVDVMNIATSITGSGLQPQTNNAQFYSIFFLIYNLLGAVVILTLFVSIIIGNFSSKTGSAFLTQPQREWIDLQKLINRQRPSKRPKMRPDGFLRGWCFDRAVHKHGWWSRGMTTIFIAHFIALMTTTFSVNTLGSQIRTYIFLFITGTYTLDVLVRLSGLGWKSYRANGWNIFDMFVAPGSLFTTLLSLFGNEGYALDQLQKLFIVCVAFKLVQRMNNLNKLFKTAVASLPVILSLLSLWIILFIFFAILMVEIFSLTKWGSGETWNQNYSSMGTALVMLAFMTSGEGWNQYMHDYAVEYPRCTNSPDGDSDCGSVVWAFTLFIAWNLLSMYIFVNMFTGVVVENFSYVFQITGGSKAVTREEMRAFKKVWAEFANKRTGYLERSNFVPFFGKLSGIFEVRIYPREHSIPQIMRASADTGDTSYGYGESKIVGEVDLVKLDNALSKVDYIAVRRRRHVYSRLYHEASMCRNSKGMSFHDMLVLLAHHKLIVDKDALILKDLVVRTETNKLVTDLVNLDRVRSLLMTLTYRRRYLAHRERQRQAKMEQDIPAIVVDDPPLTPSHRSSRDISSALHVFSDSDSPSPSPRMRSSDVFDSSFAASNTTGSPALHRSRRTSDLSMLSTDLSGYRYTRDLSPSRDPSLLVDDENTQDVFAAMQNSSWGDMMLEAEEEEEEHHR